MARPARHFYTTYLIHAFDLYHSREAAGMQGEYMTAGAGADGEGCDPAVGRVPLPHALTRTRLESHSPSTRGGAPGCLIAARRGRRPGRVTPAGPPPPARGTPSSRPHPSLPQLASELGPLPNVNGLEIVKYARGLPHRKGTPIIMLTAVGCETEALAAGADVFLRKPDDMNIPVGAIESLAGATKGGTPPPA